MSNFKLLDSKEHKEFGEVVTGRNGYNLHIDLRTGTKYRKAFSDNRINPLAPESIDLKITDYCDMSHICTFCHEASTKEGNYAPYQDIKRILNLAYTGTEIAIGGGNPLSHPDLARIIEYASSEYLIPSVTVNQLHLKKYADEIEGLITSKHCYGLGISYRGLPMDAPVYNTVREYDHTVWHLILGVHQPKDMADILSVNPSAKILLLGYKTSGFGEEHKANHPELIDNNMKAWYQSMSRWMEKDVHMSFDTLAIEQLNMNRFFTNQQWMDLYMGSDGEYTMYIDAVKEVAKQSSFSEEKGYAFNPYKGDCTIKKIFKKIKEEK